MDIIFCSIHQRNFLDLYIWHWHLIRLSETIGRNDKMFPKNASHHNSDYTSPCIVASATRRTVALSIAVQLKEYQHQEYFWFPGKYLHLHIISMFDLICSLLDLWRDKSKLCLDCRLSLTHFRFSLNLRLRFITDWQFNRKIFSSKVSLKFHQMMSD